MSQFFRNPAQVRALRAHILPELARGAGAGRPLQIWCVGCGSGEDAYTLAMLLTDAVAEFPAVEPRVLATDASTTAVTATERGRYQERALVMVDPADRQRFFYLDTSEPGYVVRDDVRRLVTVQQHDVGVDAPPFALGEVDLVVLGALPALSTGRSEREPARRVLDQVVAALRPGGYLLAPAAPVLAYLVDDYALVPLGDGYVHRRRTADDRRAVLPDRRTDDELRPTRADRRRQARDRRSDRPPQT